MKKILLALLTLILLSNSKLALAKNDTCSGATTKGDVCAIQILQVHPTQFSVGMIEVNEKKSEIEGMSEKKLKKFLKKHTIPTVVGPQHQFFMTDHHHLARALFDAGVEEMNLEIQEDWSALTDTTFWQKMDSSHLVYLFDENGDGPHVPSDLPSDVSHLRDDIYRSLAWAIQKQTGAYEDTNSPYASFLWANFFRTRVSRQIVKDNFSRAIEEGAVLARSSEAKDLPGYLGH